MEQRVAVTPDTAERLVELGVSIIMQAGAGARSFFPDTDYAEVLFVDTNEEIYARADMILCVQPPSLEELEHFSSGGLIAGFMQPYCMHKLVKQLRDRHITAFAMELVPRISRAQGMDALTSQAAIAGYKAVLLAANLAPRFFPMLTSAAGTLKPATVMVIGAGVAGLQAIATARRLGAIVQAYDIRSTTREQVLSLGARFLEFNVEADGTGGYARELSEAERKHEHEMLGKHIAMADIVITTAAVPGRPAPILIEPYMVERMHPGSVIIDLAAECGGNCSLTRPGEIVRYHDVIIHGPINLASQVTTHASQLYANNLFNLARLLIKNGELSPDWSDEVLANSILTRDGQITHAAIREQIEGRPT